MDRAPAGRNRSDGGGFIQVPQADAIDEDDRGQSGEIDGRRQGQNRVRETFRRLRQVPIPLRLEDGVLISPPLLSGRTLVEGDDYMDLNLPIQQFDDVDIGDPEDCGCYRVSKCYDYPEVANLSPTKSLKASHGLEVQFRTTEINLSPGGLQYLEDLSEDTSYHGSEGLIEKAHSGQPNLDYNYKPIALRGRFLFVLLSYTVVAIALMGAALRLLPDASRFPTTLPTFQNITEIRLRSILLSNRSPQVSSLLEQRQNETESENEANKGISTSTTQISSSSTVSSLKSPSSTAVQSSDPSPQQESSTSTVSPSEPTATTTSKQLNLPSDSPGPAPAPPSESSQISPPPLQSTLTQVSTVVGTSEPSPTPEPEPSQPSRPEDDGHDHPDENTDHPIPPSSPRPSSTSDSQPSPTEINSKPTTPSQTSKPTETQPQPQPQPQPPPTPFSSSSIFTSRSTSSYISSSGISYAGPEPAQSSHDQDDGSELPPPGSQPPLSPHSTTSPIITSETHANPSPPGESHTISNPADDGHESDLPVQTHTIEPGPPLTVPTSVPTSVPVTISVDTPVPPLPTSKISFQGPGTDATTNWTPPVLSPTEGPDHQAPTYTANLPSWPSESPGESQGPRPPQTSSQNEHDPPPPAGNSVVQGSGPPETTFTAVLPGSTIVFPTTQVLPQPETSSLPQQNLPPPVETSIAQIPNPPLAASTLVTNTVPKTQGLPPPETSGQVGQNLPPLDGTTTTQAPNPPPTTSLTLVTNLLPTIPNTQSVLPPSNPASIPHEPNSGQAPPTYVHPTSIASTIVNLQQNPPIRPIDSVQTVQQSRSVSQNLGDSLTTTLPSIGTDLITNVIHPVTNIATAIAEWEPILPSTAQFEEQPKQEPFATITLSDPPEPEITVPPETKTLTVATTREDGSSIETIVTSIIGGLVKKPGDLLVNYTSTGTDENGYVFTTTFTARQSLSTSIGTDEAGHPTTTEVLQFLFRPRPTTLANAQGIAISTSIYYEVVTTTTLLDAGGRPTRTLVTTLREEPVTTTYFDEHGFAYLTTVVLRPISETGKIPGAMPTSPAQPNSGGKGALMLHSLSDAVYFAVLILPTLIAIGISIPVRILDRNARLYQPFHAMRLDRGATASQSLCLETDGVRSLVNGFRLLGSGQLLLSLTGISVILSALLIPFTTEAFRLVLDGPSCASPEGNKRKCTVTIGVFPAPAQVVVVLLAVIAAAVATALIVLRRWKTGVKANPWSLFYMAGLATHRETRSLFRFRSARVTNREAAAKLGNMIFELEEWLENDVRKYGVMIRSQVEESALLVGAKRGGSPKKKTVGFAVDSARCETPAHSRSVNKLPFSVLSWTGKLLFLLLLSGLLIAVLTYEFVARGTEFERGIAGKAIGVRFLFALAGVLVSFFWGSFFHATAFLSPYKVLGGRSLRKKHAIRQAPPTNAFSGLRYSLSRETRDFYLFVVSLTTILSEVLPLLLGNIPCNGIQAFFAETLCSWLSVAILSVMILTVSGSFFVRWPETMRIDPSTVAGSMYYACQHVFSRSITGGYFHGVV